MRKLFNGSHTVSFHVRMKILSFRYFSLCPLPHFILGWTSYRWSFPQNQELEGRSGLGSQYTMWCGSITGMCWPALNFQTGLVFTMSNSQYGLPPMAASSFCLSTAVGMSGFTPSLLLCSIMLCYKQINTNI